jgi:hypothetical protein
MKMQSPSLTGQPAEQKINSLLDAIEMVNKEARAQGLGGGVHGTANNILNGINWMRSQSNAKEKNFLHTDRYKDMSQPAYGSRYLSNLKSELVRNNLVTRTDLMKLYQPPLKKSEDPNKNPFHTNSFFNKPRNSNPFGSMQQSSRSNFLDGTQRNLSQSAKPKNSISGAYMNETN